MEESEISIPVTILTGFLGAGKTTFLNHILNSNKDVRYAIIENEFGEQGIDNELVIKPDETIVELNNGCLCCTLNDNLYDILNELHTRRDEFDEIIIEATGVADPTGLAEPFISHPLVKRHFPLTSIICLVDAELVEDQLKDTKEALNQITFSDILLINKTDLVNTDYLPVLEESLRKLNPLASIVSGYKDNFPRIEYRRNNDKLEEALKNAHSCSSHNKENDISFPIHKPHTHHHHEHTSEVNSISFTFDQPFDLSKLQLRLSVYMTFQSNDLYRLKGLVWLASEDHQFVLQSVGKRFDFSKKRAWESSDIKQSILVFIGKNLKRPGLEKMLTSCLAKPVPTQ